MNSGGKKRGGGKQEEETGLPKSENESIPVPVHMHGSQQMRKLCAELSSCGCRHMQILLHLKVVRLTLAPGGQKGSAGTRPWLPSPQTCTVPWLTLTLLDAANEHETRHQRGTRTLARDSQLAGSVPLDPRSRPRAAVCVSGEALTTPQPPGTPGRAG